MFTIFRVISSLRIFLKITVLIGCFAVTSRAAKPEVIPSYPYAIAGEEYNLTCFTINPQKEIVWQSGKNIIKLNSANCSSQNLFGTSSPLYKYVCDSNTTFTLRIPAIRLGKEHGSEWECTADTASEHFKIDVYYEPNKTIQITGYEGRGININQNLTLRCSVENGNPVANLTWTCNGSIVEALDNSSLQEAVSDLTLRVDQSLIGLVCTCSGSHPLWREGISNQSLPLIVFYPSTEKPYITGFETFGPVREGENVNLTCTVPGGFPLTTLSWDCNGVSYSGKNESAPGVAKSVLQVVINRKFHGRQCTCRGTHPASYNEVTSITFNVYFSATFTGPTAFFGDYNRSLEVKVPFYCNPFSYLENITWFQEGIEKIPLEKDSGMTFQLNESKTIVPFYSDWREVDGQLAIMSMKDFNRKYSGEYSLIVWNGPDLNSTFHFEIFDFNEMPTMANETESSNSVESKWIVGISITCVTIVLIIVILSTQLKRRQKKKKRDRFSIPVNAPLIEMSARNPEPIIDSGYQQVTIGEMLNNPQGGASLYPEGIEKNTNAVDESSFNETNVMKMQNPNTENVNQPEPVYAQVQKNKDNGISNGETESKNDDMNSQSKKGDNSRKSELEKAEQMKLNQKDEENEHKGSNTQKDKDVKTSSGGIAAKTVPPSSPTKKKNEDTNRSFNYAELEFDPQSNPKFVIRGKNSGVEYSEVKVTAELDRLASNDEKT